MVITPNNIKDVSDNYSLYREKVVRL